MEEDKQNKEINIEPLSYFSEELGQIKDSLVEIDDLYTEIKEHYDLVKRTRERGSTTFLQFQTGNLISLKNTKYSLIKEKINLKKNISDLILKQKKSEDSDTQDNELIRRLYQELLNNDTVSKSKVLEIEESEEEIDRILNSKVIDIRRKNLEIVENKEEEIIEPVKENKDEYITGILVHKHIDSSGKGKTICSVVGVYPDGSYKKNILDKNSERDIIKNIRLNAIENKTFGVDKTTEKIYPTVVKIVNDKEDNKDKKYQKVVNFL